MVAGIDDFFRYARLRHEAYESKMIGVPKGQQSIDDVINRFSFCNVFRELDKTTIWCRKNVREAYRNSDYLIPAIVTFRMFNRIDIGEAIFCQSDMFDGGNAFDNMMRDTDHSVKILRKAIVALRPDGPYATGAYIISSPSGYTKLDGILEVIRRFLCTAAIYPDVMQEARWEDANAYLTSNKNRPSCLSLEKTWEWLRQFDYFGKFHAYEIVTDLRHTPLLRRASDVMTWANPGPGARRGLNRIYGRHLKERVSLEQMMREMREILEQSKRPRHWDNKRWPAWEMREVEHTLCEFDKWRRTHDGDGRPRSVYR